ncbi:MULTISPECIES: IclR family transcriptional regulator [unclassified Duganella]|jgi:IclR family acetate operon transcriptional repressor|uniref:IclR family transcriptional regulator n=1 Tax=unclassified Duganella TaxID=2636909 RepID=UPI00088EAD39|nr:MULTISPECIES: IclR family transcriptional regulator [unclassified Duganella]SDF56882.1 transcriptional regulator, IclR family [Duganella sp. OV458]SDI71358.1 transcriptional regulator, IclR family [Duganella sp. OV510]
MEGIQVISRAAAILREVGAQPDGLSLGKLANATGLARSTVQRIVDALEMEHLVQAGAGGVRPGWGLRRLGELPGSGISQELRGALYGLFEATHETIDLSTLSGGEVLFMDRFLSDQSERAVPAVGAIYPAYTMASGKGLLACLSNDEVAALYANTPLQRLTTHTVASIAELLAQLDGVRAGAFAYDLEEHALGRSAIGLPVGVYRDVLLSISVVMPTHRFDKQRAKVEKALLTCAERCRARLMELQAA